MKTRDEILKQPYLNISDIKKLLNVSNETAKRIHAKADALDNEQLDFRVEEHRVRTNSVLKVTGISLNQLAKQIRC